MSDIAERIAEIDRRISDLYEAKRLLEQMQEKEWEEKYYTSLNATHHKKRICDGMTFEEICQTDWWQDIANEPSGTLLG
jgi:hypothetical protein